MKDVIEKFHSDRGMSLGEALATVLIMSFVTIGIVTGVTAGVRVYRKVTEQSEAQTLLATNVAALSQYLEKGDKITTGNNSITIGYSEVSETKVVIQNGSDSNGQKGIYLQYYKLKDNLSSSDSSIDEPVGTLEPLVSTKSNTSGLYAELSNVDEADDNQTEPDDDTDQVTNFTITIKDRSDASRNVSENVQVRNTVQYPTESDAE